MSAPVTPPERPRPSNGSNPAHAGRESNTPNLDSGNDRQVPEVETRLSELWNEFPKRMRTPISVQHGRRLREEALAEPEEAKREIEVGDHETRTVYETVSREARPVGEVVASFLDWYEDYREKRLRLGRGDGIREERETFTVDLENSFQPGYQKQTYAQLQGLQRQTTGGEYPDGSEATGEFETPVTVLLGLTASGATDGGEPRPPADHDREVREAWTGSSSSVKRTLRYVLEDKLGLDSDEFAWWYQTEPHPGDGANAGYSHAHPVVVIDGAAAEPPAASITAETFRPVVAKHVAECPTAEWAAHRLDDTVEVKQAGEVEDFAAYVSEYIAVDPSEDLLERSAEYILWAATQWATTSQKNSKSGTATAAVNVDKCRQEFRDPEASQATDHAGEVVRVDGERRCAHCGETFGVSQQGTLTEARLTATGETDGDAHGDADGDESGAESDVPAWAAVPGERWADARESALVGTPTREAGEEPEWSVREASGRTPATWEPEAVVDGEEETPIGTPGGVDYGEIVVEGAESINRKVDRFLRPEWLQGARPWERHPVSEAAVRSGELPPPELVRREYAEEADPSRGVTPKEWHDDWYERRHGEAESSNAETRVDVPTEQVRHLAATTDESAVGILGRLSINPEALERVAEIVAAVR